MKEKNQSIEIQKFLKGLKQRLRLVDEFAGAKITIRYIDKKDNSKHTRSIKI